MTRMAIIASLVSVASIDPALAQPLYCSVWQGIRTCSSPGGYVSHESVWNGITTGDDNQGRELHHAIDGRGQLLKPGPLLGLEQVLGDPVRLLLGLGQFVGERIRAWKLSPTAITRPCAAPFRRSFRLSP